MERLSAWGRVEQGGLLVKMRPGATWSGGGAMYAESPSGIARRAVEDDGSYGSQTATG